MTIHALPLPGDDLTPLIRSWAKGLRAANKSPRTVDTYVDSADQLRDFLHARALPTAARDVGREHIESFMEHLLLTRKATTASVRFRAIQQFFKWLAAEGEVDESPMTRMSPPKLPETLVTPNNVTMTLTGGFTTSAVGVRQRRVGITPPRLLCVERRRRSAQRAGPSFKR